MKKITYINKDFFKTNKKTKFILATLTGTILLNSVFYEMEDSKYYSYTAEIKNSRNLSECFCEYKPMKDPFNNFDKILWDKRFENKEPRAYCPSYLDYNIVKIIIFRGASKATHYRIKFQETTLEWDELPDDNVIMFNIEDIPEKMRYNQDINIQFGTYNQSLNKIKENHCESLTRTIDSKDKITEHKKIHNKIMTIANKIVNKNDSDFEKVKKIYDYLINHTEYRYSKEGIYEQSLYKKYYMDCAGYAEFMNLALNSVGIECFSVLDDTHCHVWNIVKVDDKYYHLDATYSDTSSWENTSRYRYFLVSDSFMAADHRFFIPEKDVKCNNIYDLSAVATDKDVIHRGFFGEQINEIKDNYQIGEIIDSGYSLKYKSR